MEIELFAIGHQPCPGGIPDGISLIGTAGFHGDYVDNVCDNIAHKNARWCELTAIYWLLKNYTFRGKSIGICHYRRFFANYSTVERLSRQRGLPFYTIEQSEFELLRGQLSIEQIQRMKHQLRADIIAPEPHISQRSVLKDFQLYHASTVLDLLMAFETAVRKGYFDAEFASWFLSSHELHPCNMSILPTEFFVETWTKIFDILFAIEPNVSEKETSYQNRTFGFLSERLFSALLFWALYRTNTSLVMRLSPVVVISG